MASNFPGGSTLNRATPFDGQPVHPRVTLTDVIAFVATHDALTNGEKRKFLEILHEYRDGLPRRDQERKEIRRLFVRPAIRKLGDQLPVFSPAKER